MEGDIYTKPKLRVSPIIKQRIIDLVERMKDEVFEPILFSDNFELEFSEKTGIFQVLCFELIGILSKNQDLKELVKLDLSVYESTLNVAKTSRWLNDESKKAIVEMTNNLKDYELMVYSLIADRKSELEAVLNQIDQKELLRILYTAFLCYSLIGLMLAIKHYRRTDVLNKLLRESTKMSESLENYAESFDILTNPESTEKMKRAEQWEKQLQDN